MKIFVFESVGAKEVAIVSAPNSSEASILLAGLWNQENFRTYDKCIELKDSEYSGAEAKILIVQKIELKQPKKTQHKKWWKIWQ